MYIHVVESGDTLWSLAQRYDVNVRELIDINDLPDSERLVVGQALLIPVEQITHLVQQGETLWLIARRYGVSVETLALLNNLADPTVLFPGQALLIPTVDNIHVVQPGESLWLIARRYNTTVEALMTENQIADPNLIFPGQILRLPRPTIEVNGYLTRMGEEGRSIVESLGPYLTYVTIFSYEMREDGSLTTLDDEPVIAESRRQRVTPLMCMTNFQEGRFDSDLAHAVLQSTAVQDILIDNVLNVLRTKGYQGVNIDFEYLYPEDRQAYNQFLRRLRDRLQPEGYSLSTALAPKIRADQPGLLYEAHDYPAHGEITDFTVLMTYEWGWAGGPPWAIAPISEVRRVLDYAVTAIPRTKIMMGMPTYGRDWPLPYVPGQTLAATVSYEEALQRAIRYGANINYHPEYQAPYFRYTDEQGLEHEVWYEDARSVQAKFNTVRQYGLRGISYWEISVPFRQNWILLTNRFNIRKF